MLVITFLVGFQCPYKAAVRQAIEDTGGPDEEADVA